MTKRQLEVYITKEEDDTYDVDVFDIQENERDEGFSKYRLTLDGAKRHVKTLELKETVFFKGIR